MTNQEIPNSVFIYFHENQIQIFKLIYNPDHTRYRFATSHGFYDYDPDTMELYKQIGNSKRWDAVHIQGATEQTELM